MISYATVNRPLAVKLHERLKQDGCQPVIDYLNIRTGDRWRRKIAWWLSTCHVAIVLLSRKALESPWVRYELGVLTNREQRGNVRLVLVWVGVKPEEVRARGEFDPYQLAEIQSYHHLPSDDADDEAIDEMIDEIAASVHAFEVVEGAPVQQLIPRVADEVRRAATSRVDAVRAVLSEPGAQPDPWLSQDGEVRRSFAEAYLATPISRSYRALQSLAQDRRIRLDNLHTLVDLNVMTTFEPRQLEQLHEAGTATIRRSVVSSITRADLAEVATQALPEVHDSMYAYQFVVNGPITGDTADEIAEGIALELRHAVAAVADPDEDPDTFLTEVAALQHPVFALLARAAGIRTDVLRRLEKTFPTVSFVVLSSDGQKMPDLARELGVHGDDPALDDPNVWTSHVQGEREVATERSKQRRAVRAMKKAIER
jgi:hypothetical protein